MKLKRCPWCNRHELTLDLTRYTYAVRCLICGCIGPITNESEEEARLLWNGDGPYQNHSAILCMDKNSVGLNNRDDLKDIDLS